MKDQIEQEYEQVEIAEIVEDEPGEVTEEEQPDTDEGEVDDDDNEAEAEEEAAEDEFIVSIDGEDEKEPETPVIRTLRQNAREEKKKRKELERKLEELQASKPVELGPKPALKDYNYDEASFEAALSDWTTQKSKVEEQKRLEEETQQQQAQAWQERLSQYDTAKKALPVKDFDDAEDAVKVTFAPEQQGIIVDAAEKPELVVYALGKNPTKAAELAKITNPVRLAAAVARLEATMKVTGSKPKPAPERRIAASAPSTGGSEAKLEKLREQAAKTGDYSEVTRFKKQLRAKK